MVAVSPSDPSSYANNDKFVIKASAISWKTDFDQKILVGSVQHNILSLDSACATVVLDCKALQIHAITLGEVSLSWALGPVDACFGSPLSITLPAPVPTGTMFSLTIAYATTSGCTAVQWLDPAQTVGGEHPYLFTQCQAIHCRSILPCQDTPGVKITYSAAVSVPKGLRALMSAVPLPTPTITTGADEGEWETFRFEQKIAIPSYLIALAVGNIEGIRVGPRTTVWSEPEAVKAAAWEFESTEKFIEAGESFLTPYVWGVYDLLVLPASFPYGGMENPCLTFVTPTLVAGDRTLVDVVAHEIAHSWMGNLVGCQNWEHFWLNEGFTVFVERKIMSRMLPTPEDGSGERLRGFNSIVGLQHLKDSVDQMVKTPEYTCLCPHLGGGIDPDDVFSSVPYEKGYNLLYHLEKVTGGPSVFEHYLKAHVTEFAGKAITTSQFKDFLYSYFAKIDGDKVKALDAVDWEGWFNRPGMPPVDNKFNQELAENCKKLAELWTTGDTPKEAGFSTASFDDMKTTQRIVFFDLVQEKAPIALDRLEVMAKVYRLNEIKNCEVRFKWQMLCIASMKIDIFPAVVKFITTAGRMKYVRPLYRALRSSGPDGFALAKKTFVEHRSFYHPICSGMVAKDLGL